MDKDNTFLFDGEKVIALDKLLELISLNVNRKLSELEHSIVTFLYNDFIDRISSRFFTDGNKNILASETGNEAGVIELTEDFACAFKAGPVYAATSGEIVKPFCVMGGKVHQEIFTRGAQPLASLVSLSANFPADASAQDDFNNAVKGISTFSNTYGIPTVGGGMQFNCSGRQSMVANLLSIGLIDRDVMLSNACYGEDNAVYFIHSKNTDDSPQSHAFHLRTMYEFICDLHDDGLIAAIQSVGRNGILGACADMIVAGINGMKLCIDNHISEPDGFQKILNDIPDSIILIADKIHSGKLKKACKKWNKEFEQFGVVQAERKLSVVLKDKLVADLPVTFIDFNVLMNEKEIHLVNNAGTDKKPADVPQPENYQELARFMMTCPNLLSQQWIYEQFDSAIGTNNLSTNYISDAPVIQIKGSRHALAVSFCQNTCNINDYPEAVNLVIADSVREVVCSGGIPQALTGCLNYSGSSGAATNAKLSSISEQIAYTCKILGISSSGIETNCISQTGSAVIHDISIGAIAFLNDKHQHMTKSFKGKGDMIYLIGRSSDDLGSSEYIRSYHGIYDSPPADIDLDMEAGLLQVARKMISRKLVKSAHSISKGGLFMALLQSAMIRSFGFDITIDEDIRKDAFLFGEAPSRIVASVATAREADFVDFMIENEVSFLTLGHVTREEIRIDDNSFGFISDYKKRYLNLTN
jgi:phosphoribosylformylglycinamidine synthase